MINRIRNAKMPWDWTLNSFPFDRQPGVNKNQVMTLAGLDFLQRGENIIFHGKTGVGKSGLAVGILRHALISGSRGRFYDVQRLLDDLYASLADRSTTNLEPDAWYHLLKPKDMVDALLDRLYYRYVVIKVYGPSLRGGLPE